MRRLEGETLSSPNQAQVEMLSWMGEPASGRRWLLMRQHKIWRPPTDVYETDDNIVVKVEIAGMQQEDFSISLDARRLIISGVRHDLTAKLGYQQMEIQYGHFETDVHLPKAVDEERIEATYQDGFLSVRLPKTKPRRVPVANDTGS